MNSQTNALTVYRLPSSACETLDILPVLSPVQCPHWRLLAEIGDYSRRKRRL